MPAIEVNAALAREMGMSQEEFSRLVQRIGRAPSLCELGIVSAMWSEHCSYKSSRVHLKRLPSEGPGVVVGPGENAGAVDIGGGFCVVFKMESHNHPSYIEPFEGAATGVGGILRDVFTMGARPIALLDSLRFGDPRLQKTRQLVHGVVAGISHYGNCFGVPVVGGEITFDAAYDGNCLVNVCAVGVARADRLFLGKAAGVGNEVFYLGAKTGRDGIHGATMASDEFNAQNESRRPTVQIGDPFKEKLLLECCLELMAQDLLIGIQDMGAAGLTSSAVEMAARAENGIELDLDRLPRREPDMSAYEVMLSESQERMLFVARPGCQEEVRAIAKRWDLDAVAIGVVTDTRRLLVKARGKVEADLPISLLADESPRYERPKRPPEDLERRFASPSVEPPRDLPSVIVELVGHPDVASKRWVYEQYDHQVRAGTLIGPGGADAAVLRVLDPADSRRDTGARLALTVDCPVRACALDPLRGAQLAVYEAARNLACVGAHPIGVSDCLNLGNPERPEVAWQLSEVVDGLAEACRALSVPIVSGNVSLYNENRGRAVHPTPAVAMVGLIREAGEERAMGNGQWAMGAGGGADPAPAPEPFSLPLPHSVWEGSSSEAQTGERDPIFLPGPRFRAAGEEVALLGDAARGTLGGSLYLFAIHGKISGRPPLPNPALERRTLAATREAVRAGLLSSAHDVSGGGLAVALAHGTLGGVGAKITLPEGPLDIILFGEGHPLFVISYPKESAARVAEVVEKEGASLFSIGVTGGEFLQIDGDGRRLGTVSVADLQKSFKKGFERVL